MEVQPNRLRRRCGDEASDRSARCAASGVTSSELTRSGYVRLAQSARSWSTEQAAARDTRRKTTSRTVRHVSSQVNSVASTSTLSKLDAYTEAWLRVIASAPRTTFYAYTKE